MNSFRFDFTNGKAMTVAQVKAAEEAANELIGRNEPVYAKEAPLAVAKTIQGMFTVSYLLRASAIPTQ